MRSGRNSQRNIRNRSFTAHGLAMYLTIKNDFTKTVETKSKAIPLPRFWCAGPRPGVCTLSDRLVTVIDLQMMLQTTMRTALMWHGQGFQIVAHRYFRVWPPNTAKAIMRSTCGTILDDICRLGLKQFIFVKSGFMLAPKMLKTVLLPLASFRRHVWRLNLSIRRPPAVSFEGLETNCTLNRQVVL
jgi:hypothetical protein